jgi:hypothetical protein
MKTSFKSIASLLGCKGGESLALPVFLSKLIQGENSNFKQFDHMTCTRYAAGKCVSNLKRKFPRERQPRSGEPDMNRTDVQPLRPSSAYEMKHK